MAFFSDDPSKIILRQSDVDNDRAFSMDRDMLKVFASIVGNRNLSDIAAHAGMSLKSLKEVVHRLLAAGVAESVHDPGNVISAAFLLSIVEHLAIAIGPIASVVIDDEIDAMKESWSAFPMERAPELVNLLARQIPREEKRVAFQQAMIPFLKDMAR